MEYYSPHIFCFSYIVLITYICRRQFNLMKVVLTMAEKKIIEDRVDRLIEEEHIDTVNGIDIISVARNMGFTVGTVQSDPNIDGFIMVDENATQLLGLDTNKVIGVNKDLPFEHKRFVIAHELAHYIMDFLDVQSKSNPSQIYAHRAHQHGRSNLENNRDYFAACLLMPRKMFTQKYNELGNVSNSDKVAILSEFFKTDSLSVLRRIDELKQLKEGGFAD